MNAPASATSDRPIAGPPATRVPFTRLDHADPALFAELMGVVERVAADAAFTLGEEVESFETEFAAWSGARRAVGVSSGTSALELALRGLGVGAGDEVIVPANSFIASAEAVTAAGASPRLVDVDEDTSTLTAETVAAALTPRTRCVIPVHLYGRTVDMDPITDLCHRRGVFMVEDACQAHGALYRGRPVGSHGDAGCFSFYPTKNLGAWGDGGALITDDDELADRVSLLRSHGERSRHDHKVAAGTHRLHALQAAILRVKLKRIDEWNELRRAAGRSLREALGRSRLILPLPAAPDGDHVYHLFVVRTEARDALRRYLGDRGIASAIHYPRPIHRQPAYSRSLQGDGGLVVSEKLAARICSLPIFPALSEPEIERIAAAVEGFERDCG